MNPFADVQPRLPRPEGLNAEFYRHLAGDQLHLQQCSACGRFQHPPRHLCGACSSAELTWTAVDGVGRLYSWTTTHFPFDRGWASGLPYTTGVIELPQDIRLVAALPADVRPWTGRPVRLVVAHLDDSALLYLAAVTK